MNQHPHFGKPSGFFSGKFGFLLLGFAALAWFAIRVIPKPSRVAYPCQRAAAPLAFGFLAYLMSLAAWAALWRKMRHSLHHSRYIPAFLWLLGSLAAGLIVFWQTPSENAQAAFAPQEPPNKPIGVARGIYPGRVVWVRDPDATDWDGLTGYWWEDSHTYQRAVDEMLSLSLRRLTGTATDAGAWDALFRYFNRVHGKGDVGYRPGEKILVKINLNNSSTGTVDAKYNRIAQIDTLDASPQMIRAVLRQLVRVAGAGPADIIVGDSIRLLSNIYWNRLHAEFPEVVYIDQQGTLGRTKVQRTQVPKVYFSQGQASPDPLPVQLDEAEYLINMALLKTHSMGGVTLCAKNHFGSLGRSPTASSYHNLHNSLPQLSAGMGKYRALVDLMGSRQLGGKTLLYMIDGLWASRGQSAKPSRWTTAPFLNDWPSSLLVSQDPVAIDSVGLDFLRSEWELMADSEDYLHEAARADNPPSGTFYDPEQDGQRMASQGAHEHWNNSADKQYTRNLGTGSGIELVAAPPEAQRVYLPHIVNGQAGNLVMRTTFLLFNPSVEACAGEMELKADDGTPFAVRIREINTAMPISRVSISMRPGETRLLETDGAGPLAGGTATLTSDRPLGAAAIFSVYVSGFLMSEAGVGPSSLASEFVIPVESRGGVATGLAVFNPDGTSTSSLTLRLSNAAGQAVGAATDLDLGPYQHVARFVFGPDQFFPSSGDFSGTLRITASQPIVALTLRQNADPLAYSTLPAYAVSSPAKELIFPQVANGQYSDGSFRTALALFNFSKSAAQVTATFSRDDGTQLLAPYSTSLAPGASARMETDGAGPLTSGAARITSTQPIGAAVSFTARDPGGRLITEAGVAGAPVMAQFSLPVDLAEDFDTGLAILGPSSGSAELKMRLLDSRGAQVGETAFVLGANRHMARFVSQWFPGTGGLRGSLSISASQPVAAVALRQHAFPYALTTLPVAPGAMPGQ